MKIQTMLFATLFSTMTFANNDACKEAYSKAISNNILENESVALKDAIRANRVCVEHYVFVGSQNTATFLNSGARYCKSRQTTVAAEADCRMKVLEIVGELEQLYIPKELQK